MLTLQFAMSRTARGEDLSFVWDNSLANTTELIVSSVTAFRILAPWWFRAGGDAIGSQGRVPNPIAVTSTFKTQLAVSETTAISFPENPDNLSLSFPPHSRHSILTVIKLSTLVWLVTMNNFLITLCFLVSAEMRGQSILYYTLRAQQAVPMKFSRTRKRLMIQGRKIILCS